MLTKTCMVARMVLKVRRVTGLLSLAVSSHHTQLTRHLVTLFLSFHWPPAHQALQYSFSYFHIPASGPLHLLSPPMGCSSSTYSHGLLPYLQLDLLQCTLLNEVMRVITLLSPSSALFSITAQHQSIKLLAYLFRSAFPTRMQAPLSCSLWKTHCLEQWGIEVHL